MPDSASPSLSPPSFADKLPPLAAESAGPLYLRLQAAMRDAIHAKALPPEHALPPERDLAKELNVSRITVRKALDGLEREGLLVRRRGAGTFVANRLEKSFAQLTSFSEDMRARGRKPASQWLSRANGTVTPAEAMALGVSPGTEVYRFHRLRYADDIVVALETSIVPTWCLPSAEAVAESLYDALARSGFRPVRALQRLRGIAFTPDQAEKLGVQPGDPGLYIERRGFSADGRSCELTRSYYRGDAYDVVAELIDPR
jgi:GntR family transcriptional regulator